MTDLSKPIKRRTPVETRNAAPRQIVVTLYPAGVGRPASIGLREAGRRKEVHASLGCVWRLAWQMESDRQRAEKARAKREKNA